MERFRLMLFAYWFRSVAIHSLGLRDGIFWTVRSVLSPTLTWWWNEELTLKKTDEKVSFIVNLLSLLMIGPDR